MDSEVVIVGGGLVGGSIAVALARVGVSVVLVDSGIDAVTASRQDGPSAYDLRVFALRPGGRQFLSDCGIWRHVDERRTAPVYKMVVTGDDGVSRLNFDAYRSGIGELAVIAENDNLHAAVNLALEQSPLLTRLTGRRCESVRWQERAVTVSLDDGREIRSQLVIGADGANSRVRELAGIPVTRSAYGHSGVVANFDTGRPHDGTAWQWFRPDGVLALLPLPGNRVSMVWSTHDDHAHELTGLDGAELATRVTRASNSVHGELGSVGTGAVAFPLRLMRVASIVGARLALAGDAAHNVHPLAGQGLNLGLADAKSLIEAIVARGPDEVGSDTVLARYRRARAEENATMQFTTDGLHRLFQSHAPGAAWLRNAGLRMTERIAPLKRVLVKHAAG